MISRAWIAGRRVRFLALRSLSSLPYHKEVIMPKVSPTMTHGRFVAWKKKQGEFFEEGEEIAEVESDKATMPITAMDEGYIARIFVDPDTSDIPLGELLAIIVEEKEHVSAFESYVPKSKVKSAPSPLTSNENQDAAQEKEDLSEKPASISFSGPISPAICRLLNTYPGIDLARITPTGPKGRILKGDVLAAVADGSAFGDSKEQSAKEETSSKSVPAEKTHVEEEPSSEQVVAFTEAPISSMRRAIANRVLLSKQSVPHQYNTVTYELDALLALRKKLNSSPKSPAISVNDFIIRATAIALRRIPEMRAQWDSARGEAVRNDAIDISIAVAIPDGLILPIVARADTLGLAEIAEITKRLVSRAREGLLEPEEYEGGSFGISNLGMFGVKNFSAIISPPQSGMLAIGAGISTALAQEDGSMRAAIVGRATLSSDARVISPESAASFLQEFSKCLTEPETMLL